MQNLMFNPLTASTKASSEAPKAEDWTIKMRKLVDWLLSDRSILIGIGIGVSVFFSVIVLALALVAVFRRIRRRKRAGYLDNFNPVNRNSWTDLPSTSGGASLLNASPSNASPTNVPPLNAPQPNQHQKSSKQPTNKKSSKKQTQPQPPKPFGMNLRSGRK